MSALVAAGGDHHRARSVKESAVLSAVRRRVTAAIAASVMGLVAAGCGVMEQTQWDDDRTLGVSATANGIQVRNAMVVADYDSPDATVFAFFANAGAADELVSIRVGDVEASPEGGPLTLPARGYATVGPDHTRLDVSGVDVTPGLRVEIEFIFATAPRSTASALVVRPNDVSFGAAGP